MSCDYLLIRVGGLFYEAMEENLCRNNYRNQPFVRKLEVSSWWSHWSGNHFTLNLCLYFLRMFCSCGFMVKRAFI